MDRIILTAGRPSTEEVAAVTAALAGMAAATPPPSASGRSPAWARAARQEAVGQAPFTDASDPRLQAPSTRR
ncbi:MAG TPA: acyl-CoA carboxylase epsilon subunit [Euzebya sp.]|nr:acyl-CoA carboxylase epsilon subunit [Euzebya sp.]